MIVVLSCLWLQIRHVHVVTMKLTVVTITSWRPVSRWSATFRATCSLKPDSTTATCTAPASQQSLKWPNRRVAHFHWNYASWQTSGLKKLMFWCHFICFLWWLHLYANGNFNALYVMWLSVIMCRMKIKYSIAWTKFVIFLNLNFGFN